MKQNIKNKTSEVKALNTSAAEENVLPVYDSKATGICVFLGLCYYAAIILTAILVTMWATDTYCKNLGKEMQDSVLKQTPQVEPDISKKSNPISTENTFQSVLYNREELNRLAGTIEISSNPYKLSSEEIFEQLKTAKVASLQKRVKRFACWHSCFGQFRKKAFRTLYGSSVPLFPTPPKPTDPAVENKERKREIDPKTALAISNGKGEENNELGEGEDHKGSSEATTIKNVSSKPNTTPPDFFKLKTKVIVDKFEEKLTSSTTASSTSKKPSVTDDSQNNIVNKKKSQKDAVNRKHGSKTSTSKVEAESESEEDGNYTVEEDEEESESPEGADDDDEMSGSEEYAEDKGDGIDRKDLEAEEKR